MIRWEYAALRRNELILIFLYFISTMDRCNRAVFSAVDFLESRLVKEICLKINNAITDNSPKTNSSNNVVGEIIRKVHNVHLPQQFQRS